MDDDQDGLKSEDEDEDEPRRRVSPSLCLLFTLHAITPNDVTADFANI